MKISLQNISSILVILPIELFGSCIENMVLESMPTWFRNLMYALALSTSFELIYFLNSARRSKTKSKNDEEDGLDVVFFPDQTRACEAHFTYGCNNGSCWLSHEMTSSMKVISFLEQAQKTLDICVYCIASRELVESVLKAHESGIVVRVITDQAQALDQEGQIGKLRSAGKNCWVYCWTI